MRKVGEELLRKCYECWTDRLYTIQITAPTRWSVFLLSRCTASDSQSLEATEPIGAKGDPLAALTY